jgi:ABC-type bacteriocin/lantibiotic exporter with double-glycine peptidase domain
MKAVIFTTVFLVVFIGMCQFYEMSLALMSSMFIAGNLLVVFMVYKVLRDLYKTSKNFENWYEDNPRKVSSN